MNISIGLSAFVLHPDFLGNINMSENSPDIFCQQTQNPLRLTYSLPLSMMLIWSLITLFLIY